MFQWTRFNLFHCKLASPTPGLSCSLPLFELLSQMHANVHGFDTVSMRTQSASEIANEKPFCFFLSATTLMCKHGLGLPWLITPGKIWPPAVNTDPTIDASLALPYNHLRIKLCSALPIMEFLTPSLCHYTSRATLLVPACSACFRGAEWCQLRQNIIILNLRFQLFCILTAGDGEINPMEVVLLMDVTVNRCWKPKCLL